VQHYKLAIAIRCHMWPQLVLDTVRSVFHYSRTYPLVVLSCDANPRIGPSVQEKYPQVRYFVSQGRWGWGSGLYGLLSDTINWLDGMRDIKYDHFLSIDYDTIAIGKDFDGILLRELAKHPSVGLAGSHVPRSANWQHKYSKSRETILKCFNGQAVEWPPPNYTPGESCLGGFMWLTPQCRESMREKGFFQNPFRDIRGKIDLADDPWMALLVRASGYGILDIKKLDHYGHIAWQSPGNWRMYPEQRMRIFNLGSISRGHDKTQELLTRNFFRKLRREKYLLQIRDGDP